MDIEKNISYSPIKTNLEEIKKFLLGSFWSGSLDDFLANIKSQIIWLPFNKLTGASIFDNKNYPMLKPFKINNIKKYQEHLKNKNNEIALPPNLDIPQENIIYIPFWLLKSPFKNNWALVNATKKEIVFAHLKLKKEGAYKDLIFYLGLSLFCLFLGASILYIALSVITAMITFSPSYDKYIFAFLISIVTIILLLLMTKKILHKHLIESILQASQKKLVLPMGSSKIKIINITSYFALAVFFMFSLSLMTMIIKSPSNILCVIFSILVIILSIIFGLNALNLSNTLKKYTNPNIHYKAPNKSNIYEIISGIIDISLLSLAGGLIGGTIINSNIGIIFNLNFPRDPSIFMARGAEIGAITGIIITPFSKKERIPIISGILAQSIGEFFLGNWGGVILALITVFITSFINNNEKKFSKALYQSWGFNFAGALGALVGKIIAIFFLGPMGSKLGEIFGEKILSTAGFIYISRLLEKDQT